MPRSPNLVWHISINNINIINFMNINERNKKVALSRWAKIHAQERNVVNKNSHKKHLKARLCGFLAGDGSILVRKDNDEKMHYVLRFFPDHPSLIEPFTESLFELYSKRPIIKKDYANQGIICYSKVVVEDLLNTAKFGILSWQVPFSLLKDKRTKIEWLRAFFDSEAYVGKNNIRVQTVNERGIKEVQQLLAEFGIESKKYTYKPRNKNWKKVHILIIGSKDNQLKFLNTIGFNHQIKASKLKDNAGVA